MTVIIMKDTITLFISKGIVHELKEYESGASVVTPTPEYIKIEYPNENELKW